MIPTTPKVYLVACTGEAGEDSHVDLRLEGEPEGGVFGGYFADYLEDIGAPSRDDIEDDASEGELLPELAGRLCYRSWAPGLNPNVTKVREGNRAYMANVLAQKHGSVLEHVSLTFVFRHVSRVFTHELVRHRVGVGISQESLRYVRLDGDLPVVMPPEFEPVLGWGSYERLDSALTQILADITSTFSLDDPKTTFSVKKAITSAMRRLVPMGVGTDIMWTANIRTLRHVIEMRTDPSAEAEIRLVFDEVARLCQTIYPNLFQDFHRVNYGTHQGAWMPIHRAQMLRLLTGLHCDNFSPALPDDSTTALALEGEDARSVTVPKAWLESWLNRSRGGN